jgi:hypothetical protein
MPLNCPQESQRLRNVELRRAAVFGYGEFRIAIAKGSKATSIDIICIMLK